MAVVIDPDRRADRAVAAGVAAYARGTATWRLHVEPQPFFDVGGGAAALEPTLGRGVVTLATYEQVIRAAARAGLPVVAVATGGGGAVPTGIPLVEIDEERVAALAAEHLVEQGFRRFGFYGLASPPAAAWSEPRAGAFSRRLNAAGFACDTLLARGRPADVRGELADWVAALPRPVGIMACDDERAAQVLEACQTLRLRVPEDVAVVGVGDDEFVRELAIPALSSVALPLRNAGYEAAGLLHRLLRPAARGRGEVPLRTLLPPVGVMVRHSTDVLAIDDPVVSAAIRAIGSKAVAGLAVADLVRESRLSRWQLDQRFRRLIGRSIHEQILHVRLAEARRLVLSTDVPLKSVAKRAGFRSASYMTTLFKRRFAATPAALRTTARIARAQHGTPPAADFSSGGD